MVCMKDRDVYLVKNTDSILYRNNINSIEGEFKNGMLNGKAIFKNDQIKYDKLIFLV